VFEDVERAEAALQVVLQRAGGKGVDLVGRRGLGGIERGAQLAAEDLLNVDQRLRPDRHAPAALLAQHPARAEVEGHQAFGGTAVDALVDDRPDSSSTRSLNTKPATTSAGASAANDRRAPSSVW